MRKIIFIYIILFPVLSFAQFDKLFSKEPSDDPIIHYLIFSIMACQKDNPQPNNPPNYTGDGSGSGNTNIPMYNLRFTCISNNPYLVEIDGNSNIVQGSSFRDYQLKKGTYSWQVTQRSGYAFYPTVKSGTVTLNQDKEIVFP